MADTSAASRLKAGTLEVGGVGKSDDMGTDDALELTVSLSLTLPKRCGSSEDLVFQVDVHRP